MEDKGPGTEPAIRGMVTSPHHKDPAISQLPTGCSPGLSTSQTDGNTCAAGSAMPSSTHLTKLSDASTPAVRASQALASSHQGSCQLRWAPTHFPQDTRFQPRSASHPLNGNASLEAGKKINSTIKND